MTEREQFRTAAALRRLGWHVTRRAPRRVTPAELARLAGCHPDSVSRKLHHRLCPPCDMETGPKGARVQSVALSEELVEFMRPKR